MMESEIDIDAPLHYAEFRIFPSQDRYEACVCSGRKVENVASGVLGHLMLHLPAHQGLLSGGSDTVFRLKEPDNDDGLKWFTKLTLARFLNVVGSPEVLKTVSSVGDEINQLEEARKFHISLYTKGQAEPASSDASKNELLRAMDLRLTVLRGELAASFNRAAGGSCSVEDITDLENLCQHFGALDLRNTLRKLMDLCQMVQKPTINSRKERIVKTEEKSRISKDLKPSQSETTVKYGVSPAKAAQAERQSSTDSEESSDSGEGLPAFERSRTLIRAASPRRSASPMRRVQIGRTGSRRAAALTIKSLNYFPGRDKTFAQEHANANSSEDETSEQPPKRSETNAVRMSVQDKISLFESKQKDQASDVQKRRSTLDASSTSKSVLRRWSSSIEQSSSKQHHPETVSGCSVPMTPDDLEDGEVKMESNVVPEQNPIEDANTETPERKTSYQTRGHADVLVFEDEEESDDKLADSTEWNRQKEAELNEMLAKMMESKPVRYGNKSSENNKNRDVEVKKRGGSYDNYKERRDEKLRGEAAGKGAEKQAQYRAMQKILDVRKAEMASVKQTEVVKKKATAKTPNPRKVSPQPVNPKKESPKLMVPKKALSKGSPSPSPSPVPAVRKSWSSTLSAPSPRVGGTSPAKTPGGTSSAGTTPTRRKPQPVPSSVTRASPKTGSPQPQPKNAKPVQKNPNKTMTKVSSEKPLQASAKTLKTTKTKVQKSAEKDSSVVTPKPSLYSKVTKKSSVVPLESKPFLRKGSGGSPAVGSVTAKTKASSHQEEKESLRTSGDLTQAEAIQEVSSQPEVKTDVEAPNYCTELETETSVPSPKYEYRDSFEQSTTIEDSFEDARESALDTETGVESTISPMAWVEEDENEEDPPLPNSESMVEITSSSNVASAPMSSPRVRHSLSQMLLEETAEPDIIEWGNAENPPAMVYQKDAPKGLKRLLKFARKSNKADTNSTGSVFSEGEEDVEESKAAGKKNSDNLLRKAALHAASNELFAVHASLNGGPNSPHMLHDHFSSSATTAKAPRSFFSLSAFRGSKPN